MSTLKHVKRIKDKVRVRCSLPEPKRGSARLDGMHNGHERQRLWHSHDSDPMVVFGFGVWTQAVRLADRKRAPHLPPQTGVRALQASEPRGTAAHRRCCCLETSTCLLRDDDGINVSDSSLV